MIRVVIIGGSNVVHVVNRTTLHAAALRLVAGEGDPQNVVRIGRVAGATDVLLVTGRVDSNGFLHRTWP